MYSSTREGFLEAMCSPERLVNPTIGYIVRTSSGGVASASAWDSATISSYKVTSSSISGKAFAPGSFVASQLEVSFVETDSIKNTSFELGFMNYLTVNAAIEWDTASGHKKDSVQIGNFFIEPNGVSTGTKGYVSVKATSVNPGLNEQFSSADFESEVGFPCTIKDVVTYIAAKAGLTIKLDTEKFPNALATVDNTFSLISSYRSALTYIAELLGAFIATRRTGGIEFRKCFEGVVDAGCIFDDNYLFEVSKQENLVKPFQYISIKANKDDVGVTREIAGIDTGISYEILDNPFTYGHPEDFLEGLVAPISFQEFYPSKISLHGRADLEVGDVIEYVYKGTTYLLPICNHVFEYNGGYKSTFESIGSSDTKTVSALGMKDQIIALKQNINTLIRDLSMTKSEIVAINGSVSNISTLIQTAKSLSSKITAIEGELEKGTYWEQTAENLRLSIETVDKSLSETQGVVDENQNKLLSYFDFQADGLTIGVNNSNIKLKLGNDRIQFIKDGTMEVAYFSEGKLYVTDAQFLSSLILGNFEFVPRSNGNLSLRRRG